MARALRFERAGGRHHVVARDNERQTKMRGVASLILTNEVSRGQSRKLPLIDSFQPDVKFGGFFL